MRRPGDVLEHSVTGLLVPIEDALQLADAVERMLTEHGFAAGLADRAPQAWRQQFEIVTPVAHRDHRADHLPPRRGPRRSRGELAPGRARRALCDRVREMHTTMNPPVFACPVCGEDLPPAPG